MNANSNTIENNNCDKCGNNKEPTGECFDCVIRPSMVECGICYNLTQSPSRGFYCDHQVCGDCSNQITTCPFCRRPWDEEEEDDEEEVERSQVFNSVRSLQVLYQVRADDDEFINDNEGDWQFTTEEHARDIFSNVMDDIRAGYLNAERLRITRTPLLNEEEWNELFGMEGPPYPEVVTIQEWNGSDE